MYHTEEEREYDSCSKALSVPASEHNTHQQLSSIEAHWHWWCISRTLFCNPVRLLTFWISRNTPQNVTAVLHGSKGRCNVWQAGRGDTRKSKSSAGTWGFWKTRQRSQLKNCISTWESGKPGEGYKGKLRGYNIAQNRKSFRKWLEGEGAYGR